MALGVADLGENLISAAPECLTCRSSGCARGGSDAVRVSLGVVATWPVCTEFRFSFGVRFGKLVRFLRVSVVAWPVGIIQFRSSLAYELPYGSANFSS